ncbi:MAG: phage integrase N-terminal SAM-like domain-containing protein [Thermoanaerobaculia bacterium]
MGAHEIKEYLTHLAVERHVSASTQGHWRRFFSVSRRAGR